MSDRPERSRVTLSAPTQATLAEAFEPDFKSLGWLRQRVRDWLSRIHAAVQGAALGSISRLSGRVVCRFENSVDTHLLRATGLRSIYESPVIPGLVVARAEFFPESFDAIARLRSSCRYLYPERLYHARSFKSVPSPDQGDQIHHDFLETFSAWSDSEAGHGSSVVVVDKSLDMTLRSLTTQVGSYGLCWDPKLQTLKVVSSIAEFPAETFDDHGTMCAALAVGIDRRGEQLGTGVAPNARLVPAAIADADGFVSQTRLAEVIRIVANPAAHNLPEDPADVISCSICPGEQANGSVTLEEYLRDALDFAEQQGVVFVWAVSNREPSKVIDDQVASYPTVLAVGCVNENLLRRGAEEPSAVALVGGSGTVTIRDAWARVPNQASFGAPVIAAVAALVRAKNAALSPQDVRHLVMTGAGQLAEGGVPVVNAVAAVKSA